MPAGDMAATIILAVVFFLLGVLVSWPEDWAWYQEVLTRMLFLSVTGACIVYMFAKRQ